VLNMHYVPWIVFPLGERIISQGYPQNPWITVVIECSVLNK